MGRWVVLAVGSLGLGLVWWWLGKGLYFFLSDICEDRLALAKKMGATYTVHVDSNDAETVAKKVESTMGGMADVAIECTGVESSCQVAVYVSSNDYQQCLWSFCIMPVPFWRPLFCYLIGPQATRRGGVMVQVGIPNGEIVGLPLTNALRREVQIKTSLTYTNTLVSQQACNWFSNVNWLPNPPVREVAGINKGCFIFIDEPSRECAPF